MFGFSANFDISNADAAVKEKDLAKSSASLF